MGYGAIFSDDHRDADPDGFDRALADWQAIQDDDDLSVYVDSGGRASVHRRDRLIVAADDLGDRRLRDSFRDLGVKDDDYQAAIDDEGGVASGFASLRIGNRQGAVSATKFLRGLGGRRPLRVAPDHIMWPFQGRSYGPAFPPQLPEGSRTFASVPGKPAGDRIKVAVLDTGYIGGNAQLDQLSVRRPGDEDPWWTESPPAMSHWVGGHGTHVAGVLADAAGWEVELHHFNVGTAGSSMPLIADSELAAAVRQALDLGCRVINMSLGGPTALDLGLPALSLAIRAAAGTEGTEGAGGSDAIIVAAAGNEATSQPMFPAASKGVIGVGALDDEGGRADFSNYGPWVDCATEGVGILGPYVSGIAAPNPEGASPGPTFQGWANWSGTSFAAPYIAGRVAALLAAGATDSARVAAAMLLAGGTPLPAALQLGVRVGRVSSAATA